MTRKKLIYAAIDATVADLLYYDRKNDEDLPLDAIEEAIAAGEITADEIVAVFRKGLAEGLTP